MNKTIKNILKVTSSNVTTIISGIVVGFVLPKILSINDYGYYKTFTLYTTYIGLFNLGIADGIVLKYGGKNFNELNRKTFRSYFRWYILIHLIIFALLVFFCIVFLKNNTKFIFIALAIDMIAVNVTSYFQQISQITERFQELSFRKILQSFLSILSVLLLYFIYISYDTVSYKLYIIFLLFINIFLSLWYIKTYKEIVFGSSERLCETKRKALSLIKNGFPLLFANLCSTLILSLDRQFVNMLFDTTTYAIYAFAYNILQLVTVATSAISTVLYPTLMRTTESKLKDNYKILSSAMLIFVFGALILYFPLCIFIEWFLPKYTDSLVIFRIIFPGLSISTLVTVIMHNYYKVLGYSFLYFIRSLLILVVTFIANTVAYVLFKSPIAISIASLIVMFFWYIYIESLFRKKYKIKLHSNLIYLVLSAFGFYFITSMSNNIIGMLVYLLYYVFITLLLKKENLKNFMILIKEG